MDIRKTEEAIWEKFHIHSKDTPPYSPWLEGASRETLLELFNDMGYEYGAEIGVRAGNFSKLILEKVPQLEKLFCVDPWSAYQRVTQERQDTHYKHCVEKLSEFWSRAQIMRMTSISAITKIADESLDFVYIDGSHEFDHVMLDLILWSRKVKVGGIVAGHDYYNFYQSGVIPAVNAYTYAHGILNWYVTKDAEPSYFWVRPKHISLGGFEIL